MGSVADILREITTFQRLTASGDFHTDGGVRVLESSATTILLLLRDSGPMRPGQIAKYFDLDQSTVTRHIQRLDQLGFIQKSTDPADRRAVIVSLSAQGRRTVRREQALHESRLDLEVHDWTEEERAEFARLLHSLNQNIVARRAGELTPATVAESARSVDANETATA